MVDADTSKETIDEDAPVANILEALHAARNPEHDNEPQVMVDNQTSMDMDIQNLMDMKRSVAKNAKNKEDKSGKHRLSKAQ
jgi:hypothetical protein